MRADQHALHLHGVEMLAMWTARRPRKALGFQHLRGRRHSHEGARRRMKEKTLTRELSQRVPAHGLLQIPQPTRLLNREFQSRHFGELSADASDQCRRERQCSVSCEGQGWMSGRMLLRLTFSAKPSQFVMATRELLSWILLGY